MVWMFLGTVGVVGLLYALYWRWKRGVDAEIAEGAAIEWRRYCDIEPEIVAGVSEAEFNSVYRRAHMPRFPGYALAIIATFLLSLPASLALIAGSLWASEKLGIAPAPIEIVRYVQLGEPEPTQAWQCNAICQLYVAEAFSGFYFYFLILFFWLAIVAFFSRRFHKNRPGYFRDELLRYREDRQTQKG